MFVIKVDFFYGRVYNVKKRRIHYSFMIRLYSHNIWGNMPKEARISNRNDLIKELICEIKPDFCNFQECNPKTSRAVDNAIQKIIADRYAESNAAHAHENFTPVFYLRERFLELDGGFIVYDGLNDANSKSVTWGLFEDKEDGKKVVVVSTHFWWQFRGDLDNEQRVVNAVQLKVICDKIIEKYGDIAVIVSGDLNSGENAPQSTSGYDAMIANGFVDVRYTAESTADTHTLHSYPVLTEDGTYVAGASEAEGGERERTIDYVFTYGQKPRITSFRVLDDKKARTTSDHCPIVAEFDI